MFKKIFSIQFLSILIFSSPAFSANQITLHFVPSPKGINWSKPSALAFSTLKNELARSPGGGRHSIGHVFEELECGNFHQYFGQTSAAGNQEKDAIFKEKVGLGVVLKKYKGELDSNESASGELSDMNLKGRSSFVRFNVSEKTCARMMEYLSEYQALGYDKIYAGLDSFPLKRQGSGCSAFGASFLEVAGLQAKEFEEQWMRAVILPHRFIGGANTGRKVSFFKILLSVRAAWAPSAEYGVPIHFWDPDLMNQWTVDAWNDLDQQKPRYFPWPVVPAKIQNSKGLIFEASTVETPNGPIFNVP